MGLPWSPLLPMAVARWRPCRGGDERAPARALAALVLVPLSLSRGKIDYYLLPLYPAVSLLLGRYLAATPWSGLDRMVGPGGAPGRGWSTRLPGAASAAGAGRVAAGGLRARLAAGGAAAVGALVLLAVAAAPLPRRAAALAGIVAAAWFLAVAFFLPAFARSQPNRAMVEDVARERQYRPDLRLAYCSDPTRVRRDVLFEVRLAATAECELWSLAGSRVPYLLLATPAEDASFRVDPRYRHVATYQTCRRTR